MLLLLTDGIAGDVAGDGDVVWLLAEVLWLLTDGIAGDGVVVWLLTEVLWLLTGVL